MNALVKGEEDKNGETKILVVVLVEMQNSVTINIKRW